MRTFIIQLLITLLLAFLFGLLAGWSFWGRREPSGVTVVPTNTPTQQPAPVKTDLAEASDAADLMRIDGVGPKSAAALHAAGLVSVEDIAKADESVLQSALDTGGVRVRPALDRWREHAATLISPDPADSEPDVPHDDLTRLNGVGPKAAAALHTAGWHTFAKLAVASESELRAALDQAGMRATPHLSTWASQAAGLAAATTPDSDAADS